MKIAVGNDHAGFDLKNKIKEVIVALGHEVVDFGCDSGDSVDYPDHAHPLAQSVESKDCDLGILMCGSGNGINMSANKHQGIRSALCWEVDIAEMARQHNNANVLALPARYISEDKALDILRAFLSTEFEGGRHQRRIEKIATEC